MIMQIILQPVLFQPDKDIISTLENTLSEEFNASIVTASPIKEISDQQLQYQQHQYGSEQQYQQRININEKIYHLIKEIGNVYG